jgi:hypothetical protein
MTTETLPVLDAIRARHTVRNFAGQLSAEKQSAVTQAITESLALPRPFGTEVEISIHPPGLGRLGVVSGEAGWMIGKVRAGIEDTRLHCVDLGFALHEAVIRLTQHGIATIWFGMYNADVAEKATPGFKVPGAVAYGEEAGKAGVFSRFLSWVSGSRTRLPFEQLFFDGANGRPFTEDTAGAQLDLLKVVQSGPSALNKQPWRLLIVDTSVHVYNAGTQPWTAFDIGIALAGIQLYAASIGKWVEFGVEAAPPSQPLGGTYVITVRIKD